MFWQRIAKLKSNQLTNIFEINNSWKKLKNKKYLNIIKSIKEKGYVIVDDFQLEKTFKKKHISSISESINILEYKDENSLYGGKDYLKFIDTSKIPKPILKNFYEYFTSDFFIDLTRTYFGEEPLLTEISLLISPKTNKRKLNIYKGSQCWHSDFADTKILKFFIYLDDVLKESGPLEIIDKINTKKILKTNNYRWGGSKSHDDSLVPEEFTKYNSLIADKGSIVIADTVSCLHRGSRNPEKQRLILLGSFYTKTSFRYPPLNWLFPKFLQKILLPLSSPIFSLDKNKFFIDKYGLNL